MKVDVSNQNNSFKHRFDPSDWLKGASISLPMYLKEKLINLNISENRPNNQISGKLLKPTGAIELIMF